MSNTSRPERVGHIVCVHFLHLDSVDFKRFPIVMHPKSDNSLYTIEGKPRPMLVIGPNGKPAFGVQWYWVLKLTSKHRPKYIPLGHPLDDRTKSFAEPKYYSYPENLIENHVKATISPWKLQSVISEVRGILGGRL